MDRKISVMCPDCGQGLCHPNHLDNALVCHRCKATYPKINGVVDMVRVEPAARSLSQWLFEWSPLVSLYESRLWRRNPLFERITQISFEQESHSILDAANLKGNERVLDLACGTGNYARLMAHNVPQGSVMAVDLSVPMLEYAAHRAHEEGLSNIHFLRADALSIPMADNSFDVINCCGALHLFPDVDSVLAEIQRLLKPGGRFTTAVFRRQKGWFFSSLAWLSQRVMGVKTMSLAWLVVHLHKAGLHDSRPYHDRGRWLVMRSTKD